MRVGGTRPIRVDVRLLAATNRDLEERIRAGQFREDLYFRLNVVAIRIPCLRERREDLPVLVEQFLEELIRDNDLPPRQLDPDIHEVFARYSWPGNVRELKNLVESLVLTSAGDEITVDDLPDRLLRPGGREEPPDRLRPGMTVQEAERELIRRTLEHVGGNRTRAARLLDIGVRTLQRKIRRYGMS
jgi:DNA-binding NtrC family response regulator